MTSARPEAIHAASDLAESQSGQHPPVAPGRPVFDGLSVVLAVLGRRSASPVTAALEHAGASVRATFNLTDARRSTAATAGPFFATVVVDPPAIAIAGSIRAGLRALARHGAVLVLSEDATTRERVYLLDSGADSVVGSTDPNEVVATLAAVLRRSRMPTRKVVSQILCAGEICVHLLHRTATAAGQTLTLTPLEFDLLAYFLIHAGEALSRDRLLANVWGHDIGGRETVTVHVRRLRQKIETDPSRPILLQTVWGFGYRLNPGPPAVPAAVRPDLLSANDG